MALHGWIEKKAGTEIPYRLFIGGWFPYFPDGRSSGGIGVALKLSHRVKNKASNPTHDIAIFDSVISPYSLKYLALCLSNLRVPGIDVLIYFLAMSGNAILTITFWEFRPESVPD